MRRLLLALLLLTVTGCARETVLVPVGAGAAPHPRASRAAGAMSRRIPEGQACLDWLRGSHVAHHPLAPRPGMTTPVRVEGPIGGVRFHSAGRAAVVCDCRLAVALHWMAPELRAMGVTDVEHSGAYVFRTQKNGRPSLHALGLAIDVHGVAVNGRMLSVESSYRRGLAHACLPAGSAINEMTCRLSQSGLFQELITPDDNRDHHDHLHLAIAPL